MHTINKMSKTSTWIVRLMIGVAVCLVFPAGWAQASNCCKLSEPQPPVQNTFKVSGAPELTVSNINGPIHVIGDSNGENPAERDRNCSRQLY